MLFFIGIVAIGAPALQSPTTISMQRIAIIGVGLVGGSLGLVWKNRTRGFEIVGFDEQSVLERAVQLGAIDRGTTSLEDVVRDADFVILATPIGSILELVECIAPVVKAGAMVTDVGSVKAPIVDWATRVLPDDVPFVGGHPMAGSERRGIDYADALLFENAAYVLCPPHGLDSETFRTHHAPLLDLVEATGAQVILLEPSRHDRIAAIVSHLPQLLAVALMNHAAAEDGEDNACLKLAAGGFRDMTRIASSPFGVWSDILATNESPILDEMDAFVTRLQTLRGHLAARHVERLHEGFGHARSARESIPRNTKGFLHPLADVYVYAEDRPGELFAIIATLHENRLNIKDIELLKIREGTGGAFRIGFADDVDAAFATAVLTEKGYVAYRL